CGSPAAARGKRAARLRKDGLRPSRLPWRAPDPIERSVYPPGVRFAPRGRSERGIVALRISRRFCMSQQPVRRAQRSSRSLAGGLFALAVLTFLASCSSSSPSSSSAAIPPSCPPGTAFRGFVVNSVTLPASGATFAVDLNGDTTPDNQYQAIVA